MGVPSASSGGNCWRSSGCPTQGVSYPGTTGISSHTGELNPHQDQGVDEIEQAMRTTESLSVSGDPRPGPSTGFSGLVLPVSRVTPTMSLPYPDEEDENGAGASEATPGRRVVKRAKIKRTRHVATFSKPE